MLRELEDKGYLTRERTHGEGGYFEWNVTAHERPVSESDQTETTPNDPGRSDGTAPGNPRGDGVASDPDHIEVSASDGGTDAPENPPNNGRKTPDSLNDSFTEKWSNRSDRPSGSEKTGDSDQQAENHADSDAGDHNSFTETAFAANPAISRFRGNGDPENRRSSTLPVDFKGGTLHIPNEIFTEPPFRGSRPFSRLPYMDEPYMDEPYMANATLHSIEGTQYRLNKNYKLLPYPGCYTCKGGANARNAGGSSLSLVFEIFGNGDEAPVVEVGPNGVSPHGDDGQSAPPNPSRQSTGGRTADEEHASTSESTNTPHGPENRNGERGGDSGDSGDSGEKTYTREEFFRKLNEQVDGYDLDPDSNPTFTEEGQRQKQEEEKPQWNRTITEEDEAFADDYKIPPRNAMHLRRMANGEYDATDFSDEGTYHEDGVDSWPIRAYKLAHPKYELDPRQKKLIEKTLMHGRAPDAQMWAEVLLLGIKEFWWDYNVKARCDRYDKRHRARAAAASDMPDWITEKDPYAPMSSGWGKPASAINAPQIDSVDDPSVEEPESSPPKE